MSFSTLLPERAATLAAVASLAVVGLNISASPVQATTAAHPVIAAAPADPAEVAIPARRLPAGGYAMPGLARGDRDFAGHGPEVTLVAHLEVRPTYITAIVSMKAKETAPDHTSAAGNWAYLLYAAPSGRCIADVNIGPTDELRYTDTDYDRDIFLSQVANSFVDQYKFVGDTAGDDVGVTTGVVMWTEKFKAVTVAC